jgi:hypothetical protein
MSEAWNPFQSESSVVVVSYICEVTALKYLYFGVEALRFDSLRAEST